MTRKKAENPAEIHAFIGCVTLSLLKTGQPVHSYEITALLKQLAEQAADPGVKEACFKALRLVADKMH